MSLPCDLLCKAARRRYRMRRTAVLKSKAATCELMSLMPPSTSVKNGHAHLGQWQACNPAEFGHRLEIIEKKLDSLLAFAPPGISNPCGGNVFDAFPTVPEYIPSMSLASFAVVPDYGVPSDSLFRQCSAVRILQSWWRRCVQKRSQDLCKVLPASVAELDICRDSALTDGWNPWDFMELREIESIAATHKFNFVLIASRTSLYENSSLLSLLPETTLESRLNRSPFAGKLPSTGQADFSSVQVHIPDQGKEEHEKKQVATNCGNRDDTEEADKIKQASSIRIAAVQKLPDEAFLSEQAYWLAKFITDSMELNDVALQVSDQIITTRDGLVEELRLEEKRQLDELADQVLGTIQDSSSESNAEEICTECREAMANTQLDEQLSADQCDKCHRLHHACCLTSYTSMSGEWILCKICGQEYAQELQLKQMVDDDALVQPWVNSEDVQSPKPAQTLEASRSEAPEGDCEKAMVTLQSRLDYMLKFVEGQHVMSCSISTTDRNSIVSKVKSTLAWKLQTRQAAEIQAATQELDAMMTTIVSKCRTGG